MTERSDALGLFRMAMGDQAANFRYGQWEAIDALVNRRERLLVIQKTGWGKSSVYFIATRILRDRGFGPTLIVSPLLALMRNQIETANRFGICALTINSANKEIWPDLQRSMCEDQADALLISPERLADDDFVKNVLLPIARQISLIVVDEAHCISDWGHDFRPDYRRLVNVLQRIPENVPILGTTATANNRVVKDVQVQLGNITIQRGTLTRETLALQTLRLQSQAARLAWLAEHIHSLPGTGIIYTLTRRDANQVADWLQKHGALAHAYYSGITNTDFKDSDAYRQYLEEQLSMNKMKALVATTALGMGYDKPDLGFVVHYQAPGSIITYYQQVGRAGRGINYAIGILMSGIEDDNIHRYFRKSAFPRDQWVATILGALEKSDGMSISQLESAVNLGRRQIEQALKFLSVESPAPVIKSAGIWQRTPVQYVMDHAQIRRLSKQRIVEWKQVQDYIKEEKCLMMFLANALDDIDPQPCGKCASCLGHPIVAPSPARETVINAARFLRHSEFPLRCKIKIARDAFTQYRFHGKIPVELRAETGRILSRWGDAGWGQLVADDKCNGRFRDELVGAVVEMVKKRWQPTPSPEWVTCIPSRKQPDLVPDYARRLAETLRLPFKPIIAKIKENDQQKFQQNSFYQCRNLDGVFSIKTPVPEGPVFLIDDVVDSGWTLTIAAALLRQAGSGPVWPLTLTTSRMGA